MSIICAKCGCKHVTCMAVINANSKEFIELPDNALKEGYCNNCHASVPLIDEDHLIKYMHDSFYDYTNRHGTEPMYVACSVFYIDENNFKKDAYIRLDKDSDDNRPDELEVECYAMGLRELQNLIRDSCYGFTIVDIHSMFSIVNGERIY